MPTDVLPWQPPEDAGWAFAEREEVVPKPSKEYRQLRKELAVALAPVLMQEHIASRKEQIASKSKVDGKTKADEADEADVSDLDDVATFLAMVSHAFATRVLEEQ